jgi:hypothetical protein
VLDLYLAAMRPRTAVDFACHAGTSGHPAALFAHGRAASELLDFLDQRTDSRTKDARHLPGDTSGFGLDGCCHKGGMRAR